ncbi:MAG: winged helix-turn-helix transcriptional regulator [Acidimicrobiia bacterium]|nr:winged helix-turn-helix transcriptional regulator [Acidimicrobiia bacterium]
MSNRSVAIRQEGGGVPALDGRWTVRLLAALAAGPLHYSDIARALEGISPTVLNERLRDVVDRDLVRHGGNGSPYSLAASTAPLADALRELRARAQVVDGSRRALAPPGGVLGIMERRWALAILMCLLDGPKRYSEIGKTLPAMSGYTQSHRMRELADARLVERRVAQGPPVSTSYLLSPEGEGLRPALEAIRRWAEDPRRR